MISIKKFLVIILLFICIRTETVEHDYKVSKNHGLDMATSEKFLISSFYKPADLICLASCNSNPECLTIVYDQNQGMIRNCFMFNRYFNSSELIPLSTSNVYEKKLIKYCLKKINYYLISFLGLLNVFRYSTIRSNISALDGMNPSWLLGFGFFSSCNASYYVMDKGASKVYILNEDWSYVSYKIFPGPAYMMQIGKRGANVSVQSRFGETALHYGSSYFKILTCKINLLIL